MVKNIPQVPEKKVTAEKVVKEKKSDIPVKSLTMATQMKDSSEIKPVSEKLYTVETPEFIAVFSSVGATLKSFKLKNYRETTEKNSPLKELVSSLKGDCITKIKSGGGVDLSKVNFVADVQSENLLITKSSGSISFAYRTPGNFIFKKTYTFTPGNYLFDMDVSLNNQMGASFATSLEFVLNSMKLESKQMGFVGPALYYKDKLHQIDSDEFDKDGSVSEKIRWGALEGVYFMSALIPDSETTLQTNMKIVKGDSEIKSKEYINFNFITSPFVVKNGETKSFKYHFYFGPKQLDILKKTGFELKKAVDFGFFDIISKPCLIVLNYIYKVIPNYGVAIILLTLLVKILFWPLGTKSAKSMNQMKKVQPLMQEIRNKYKNDKQKMNQEVMNLYKTYKVNPLSGCLPMVVQIPIFIGLYRMLYSAIELRHAPFLFWIKDLAAPDRLFNFGSVIPYMSNPDGIPVLTLIMGVSMFLQQKMTPTGGDASQAKMMMLMPVFITVLFINFPAGLVLYMLVNNIFSMAQQYYVTSSLSK